jgi:hypothetical protein
VAGANPIVALRNVAIWTSRDFKAEATTRGAVAVEAHLRLENGKLAGTVSNRGLATVRRLTLFTTDGRTALLAAQLAPGSTADVSATLRSAPVQPGDTASNSGDKPSAVMSAAAGTITSPPSGVQALAGVVDGLPGFRVGGLVPTRSLVAAFAQPVALESVDTLPPGWSAPRLVDGNGLTGDPVSVVDYELPRLPSSVPLKISAGNASPNGAPVLPDQKPPVEIYDWATSGWSAADLSLPFVLSAGERGPDLVRLRVRGNLSLLGLEVSAA